MLFVWLVFFQPLSVPSLAVHDVIQFCNIATCLKIRKLSDRGYLEANFANSGSSTFKCMFEGEEEERNNSLLKDQTFSDFENK